MPKLYSLPSLTLLTLALFFYLFAVVTTQLSTAHSARAQTSQTPCTNYYTPGVPIPSGYGAAYDLTGGGQTEVLANCAKATPTFDVGRSVSTDYVYKLAYVYQNNAWAPQTLTSSSALVSSNWYTAFANVAIPSSSLSSSWTYAVGYVCAWNGLSWKCGCADSACATGKWQLQAYERPAQTTTTGGTTGSTNSPDGSTITPTSGGSLTTSAGRWTFGAAKGDGNYFILLNAGQVNSTAAAVLLLVYNNGNMYQETVQGTWWQYTGTGSIGWTQITGDPRGSTTGGGGSPCKNPTPPHPAAAVGFTTLTYCADFTQQSSINNVFNGVAQTTNWTRMSWLDCNPLHQGAVAGKQWFKYDTISGTLGGPCGAVTVAPDSLSGVNALQITLQPSYGQTPMGLTTAVDPCSDTTNACYLVIPGTNIYAEINWRQDNSELNNTTNHDMNFWSWPASTTSNSGCIEIDYIEYFASGSPGSYSPFPVGPGAGNGQTINSCSPGGSASGDGMHMTVDSNYHTIGSLWSSDRSTKFSGCNYVDGVGAQIDTCKINTGIAPAAYVQESYLVLSNEAAKAGAVTGPVHLYIAWIRIWSCAGWTTTGNPQTTSNTCSVSSPPTTPP